MSGSLCLFSVDASSPSQMPQRPHLRARQVSLSWPLTEKPSEQTRLQQFATIFILSCLSLIEGKWSCNSVGRNAFTGLPELLPRNPESPLFTSLKRLHNHGSREKGTWAEKSPCGTRREELPDVTCQHQRWSVMRWEHRDVGVNRVKGSWHGWEGRSTKEKTTILLSWDVSGRLLSRSCTLVTAFSWHTCCYQQKWELVHRFVAKVDLERFFF